MVVLSVSNTFRIVFQNEKDVQFRLLTSMRQIKKLESSCGIEQQTIGSPSPLPIDSRNTGAYVACCHAWVPHYKEKKRCAIPLPFVVRLGRPLLALIFSRLL